MRLPRRSRLIAAAITLFSILFMQLAVASYVCPALIAGHEQQVEASIEVATADMTSCHEIDPDEPSLCHAHDQAGNQSLDKPGVPILQPFLATGFWLPLTPTGTEPFLVGPARQTTFLEHATAPPLAVRNCCYRI